MCHKLCKGRGGTFFKNSIFKMMPPFLGQKWPKKGHFSKNREFSMMTPPRHLFHPTPPPSHSKRHFPKMNLPGRRGSIRVIIIIFINYKSFRDRLQKPVNCLEESVKSTYKRKIVAPFFD